MKFNYHNISLTSLNFSWSKCLSVAYSEVDINSICTRALKKLQYLTPTLRIIPLKQNIYIFFTFTHGTLILFGEESEANVHSSISKRRFPHPHYSFISSFMMRMDKTIVYISLSLLPSVPFFQHSPCYTPLIEHS